VASVKKKGLGKGLGALIAPSAEPAAVDPSPVTVAGPVAYVAPAQDPNEPHLINLDPHAIEPNPKQPRREFSEESLHELAESIKRDGVQEPILVRKVDDKYELVCGERRVRASIIAGLENIPAVCRPVSDRDMLKLGLIENIQREDLNPIDLAIAYDGLIKEFGWTQEQLAEEVGKKRATITNALRLLNLPEDIQRYVIDGTLTMGHARALLALESQDAQRAAAHKIIDQGLSVRQAEKLSSPRQLRISPTPVRKDPNIAQLENDLRHSLGTKVTVKASKKNRGRIEIEYFSLDELERLLAILRRDR